MGKEKEEETSYVSQSLQQTLPMDEKEKIEEKAANKSGSATPTAKRTVSVVSTPGSAASTPGSATVTPNMKKLTPGQKAKREESLRKREALEKERKEKKEAAEKERIAKKEALQKEKEEKEKQRLEEKVKKEQMKEVERRAKEVEKMEKERQRKAKEQEKKEERLKKKAEKEAEQKTKEEEKLKKEEEKKKLEEAEEEKRKKKAESFKSFFTKDEAKEKQLIMAKEEATEAIHSIFTQFRVKANMRLAPLVRADPAKAKASIDALDMPSGPDGLYLALLSSSAYSKGTMTRTWPYEKKDDEVQVLDEADDDDEESCGAARFLSRAQNLEVPVIPKAKLLQFHENQRPAYWGTWTKKSSFVSGRKPFGLDKERFDYDYESDDDWEEEEEGESLSDEEKDKDEDKEENEDDYEVDNEFFVPHGYLSDEEEER